MNERLVSFVYDMVAYHAPSGAVEEMIKKAEMTPVDGEEPDPFDQSHIERFARDMAKRLEDDGIN
jgi:hypothetical protein